MKKTVLLLLSMAVLLCGCSRTPSGCAAELTRCGWTAALDGGGVLTLRFEGEEAALTLQNGGAEEVIAGACLADDTSLIIFDRAGVRRYCFAYEPKGASLDLTYEGHTVTFTADETE